MKKTETDMTNQKDQLTEELREKVKEGVKPSDLKKLKRSKSADDINIPLPPPLPLVNEQLQEKQKEIENLRKQLEDVNAELKETKQQLDNSLSARVEGVKVFGKEYDKRKKAQQELNRTIDESSDELVKGDAKISQLKTKLFTANQQINSLQQELKRAKISSKNNPSSSDELPPSLNYLKYTLYSLLAVIFTLWLTNNLSKQNHD